MKKSRTTIIVALLLLAGGAAWWGLSIETLDTSVSAKEAPRKTASKPGRQPVRQTASRPLGLDEEEADDEAPEESEQFGDVLGDRDSMRRLGEAIAAKLGGRVEYTECRENLPCSVVIAEQNYMELVDELEYELAKAAPAGHKALTMPSSIHRDDIHSVAFLYMPEDYEFADLSAEELLESDPLLSQLDRMHGAYLDVALQEDLQRKIASGEAYERMNENPETELVFGGEE